MVYILFLDSPIGRLKITSNATAILSVEHEGDGEESKNPPEVLQRCRQQLQQYFAGKRVMFDVPLQFEGTTFQRQVWQALQQIPYGEVKSYKDVAIAIGNEKAVRAVGGANNKNKLPILIPCHRVIGANGSLVGYALGLEHKQLLLELESRR